MWTLQAACGQLWCHENTTLLRDSAAMKPVHHSLHHEDGGSKVLRNIGFTTQKTATYSVLHYNATIHTCWLLITIHTLVHRCSAAFFYLKMKAFAEQGRHIVAQVTVGRGQMRREKVWAAAVWSVLASGWDGPHIWVVATYESTDAFCFCCTS